MFDGSDKVFEFSDKVFDGSEEMIDAIVIWTCLGRGKKVKLRSFREFCPKFDVSHSFNVISSSSVNRF